MNNKLYGVWIIDPNFPETDSRWTNHWMHDMDAKCYGHCDEHDWKGTKEEAERWAAHGNTPKANAKGWRLEVREYGRSAGAMVAGPGESDSCFDSGSW